MIQLLLALIVAVTGIDRQVDEELMELANLRAQQVTVNFSHDGWPAGTSEIIAWNNDATAAQLGITVEALAVQQWRDSPPHWAILSDPNTSSIGCGHATTGDGRHFWVCLTANGTVPAPPVGTEPAPALPNTSMEVP